VRQHAQVDRGGWLDLLGLAEAEVPALLVLEGTWWRQQALDRRLPALTGVRELGMPDLWHGWLGDLPVAYCPAYGSSRAVEPVHVLGTCGTPAVVQIGSCGGLQPQVRTGDVVVSERATIGEGASRYYGRRGAVPADPHMLDRAVGLLRGRGLPVHRGPTVTTDALLAQPDELVRSWASAGHLGVDMETSAVFSAALAMGMRAASLLYVWDELPGRSWTDAFTAAEQQAHEAASTAVHEVALALT
jgi:hypothetical protein